MLSLTEDTQVTEHVLALDLGVTTGYAVSSIERPDPDAIIWQLLAYGNIEATGYEQELKNLLDRWRPGYVVAERVVIYRGSLGDQLQKVMAITTQVLGSRVEFVDPARWKATPFKNHPTPRFLTTHTKDAYRLGAWYIHQLQGK